MRTAKWSMVVVVLVAMAASAQSQSDALTQAKDHFRRGTQLYDLGHFLDAAVEYEAAFTLSDKAGFLFNIGQAYRHHRLGGKSKDARAAYEGYLRRAPDAPERAQAEAYIAELTRQIEADATAQKPAAPVAPPLSRSAAGGSGRPHRQAGRILHRHGACGKWPRGGRRARRGHSCLCHSRHRHAPARRQRALGAVPQSLKRQRQSPGWHR